MGRREFIVFLGCTTVCPTPVGAQQVKKVSLIGYLGTSSPSLEVHVLDAFRQKLRELGHVEGDNTAIEYRWAQGEDHRLPELAAQLVRLNPDVIITAGTPGTLAAKRASSTIPIVFAGSGDPVNSGLVASLPRPGGNITGVTFTGPELEGKRLQILKDLLPETSRVGVLWNSASMGAEFYKETQAAATALGVALGPVVDAAHMDLKQALATIGDASPQAFIVLADRLLLSNRAQIVAFAASKKLPTIYPYREYVDAGGLVAYAPSSIDRFRRAAVYVDKILRGVKPADLPVEQPIMFEITINNRTAKSLGLTVPPTLLSSADEVIE